MGPPPDGFDGAPHEDSTLGPLNDPDWSADNAISVVRTQQAVYGTGTGTAPGDPNHSPERFAVELLSEWLPAVVMGMIHTALHDSDSRTRFSAQKYIMDRQLGLASAATAPDSDDVIRNLLHDVVVVQGEVVDSE